ncbi:MAG: OmpH family outer membrane protein [Fusobacteriaceae bacterium]|jgi:outer membrane protein|nr:OmpH family outer membrane protein [Fusobacteriaceae bacterium]
MKKITVILAVLGVSVSALAQNIGVVNARLVMEGYTQTRQIYQELENKRKIIETDLSKDEVEIQKLQLELNAAGNPTDAQKKNYQDKVTKFQQKIQAKQQELAGEETKKMQEIQGKINTAVAAVAKAGKYDLVLEFNAVMYTANAKDITPDVVKEINKAPAPAAAAPAAAQQPAKKK